MEHVIIGNGPAALAAAERIRKRDSMASIRMLSCETERAYSPCPLAEYVEGSISREHLFLRDDTFYKVNEIEIDYGVRARKILSEENSLELDDNRKISYDRLLIAAGAIATIPPIEGIQSVTDGIFSLKTLKDADGILEKSRHAEKAVVLGSGFIGMEAAQALQRRGLHVTLIEAERQILPGMLNETGSELIRRKFEENGIDIITSDRATEIHSNKGVLTSIETKSGKTVLCDILICATGVKPDLSILEGSSIATQRGILIDSMMETSIPGIFAAGDISEGLDNSGNRTYIPNWFNAVRGGEVAGHNMSGGKRQLPGLLQTNVLRVFHQPVFSFGAIVAENDDTVLERIYEKDFRYRRLLLRKGKIAGFQSVGSFRATGVLMELMNKKRDVTALADSLLDDSFGYGKLLVR